MVWIVIYFLMTIQSSFTHSIKFCIFLHRNYYNSIKFHSFYWVLLIQLSFAFPIFSEISQNVDNLTDATMQVERERAGANKRKRSTNELQLGYCTIGWHVSLYQVIAVTAASFSQLLKSSLFIACLFQVVSSNLSVKRENHSHCALAFSIASLALFSLSHSTPTSPYPYLPWLSPLRDSTWCTARQNRPLPLTWPLLNHSMTATVPEHCSTNHLTLFCFTTFLSHLCWTRTGWNW